MVDMIDHDPGDEDRSPNGPWCVRCGDAFEAPERDCPNPAPGRPYVDCGRGGHMFSAREPVDFHIVVPGIVLVPPRHAMTCEAARKPSLAERRAAHGMPELSAEERAGNLADVIDRRHAVTSRGLAARPNQAACLHTWEADDAVPWRVGGRRCSRCQVTGYRDSLGRIVEDQR